MLANYEKIIGKVKLQKLWQLFLVDADEKMKRATLAQGEELRLIFHNLRSSSLMFDMSEFANICKEIEERLIHKQNVSEKDLSKSKEILKNNIQNVMEYFNAADEND